MKKSTKKFYKIILILLSMVMLITLGTGCSGKSKEKKRMEMKEVVTEIRSRDNFVKLEDINQDFLDAIVATEDFRFYSHGAIEIRSLVRAMINNIKAKELVQGGSTITQQVIKNIYFNNDQTIKRKISEMFLAFQMEKWYGKDEILELYVNIIYFGDNNYGIKEAANNYFQKEPIDLTYDEGTLLAGLPQAPSTYALSENMEGAKVRQQQVIKALEKYRDN